MNRILTIQQLPEVHKILKYAETRIRKVTGYRAYVKIENINLPSEPPKKIQLLIEVVTTNYEVSWLDIIGRSRLPNIVTARFAFIYLSYTMYKMGKSEIARLILRDHTTIIHSIEQVRNWISVNDPIQNELQTIIAKINETKN